MNETVVYDPTIKWSEIVDKKILENNEDYESDEVSDNEVNDILNFSIDNEQILTEIKQILDQNVDEQIDSFKMFFCKSLIPIS